MVEQTRERRLIDTFVALSDTLVADYDVVDLLQGLVDRTAAIFGAASVGVLLAAPNGALEVLASTDENARLIDVMQVRSGAGPCVESFRSGSMVQVPDVRLVRPEWSEIRDELLELGLLAVQAVPMRLRGRSIGSLNIFRSSVGSFSEDDAAVAQALADVATIGILHQRALMESDAVRTQLQRALDSRVTIEQAKGAVAHAKDVTVDEAFVRIRTYARAHGLLLSEVATQIIRFELDV